MKLKSTAVYPKVMPTLEYQRKKFMTSIWTFEYILAALVSNQLKTIPILSLNLQEQLL